ncbi:MAG TPA: hypothetical protein VFK45_05725, partial [Gammaproteobacteria bacterium]|nr:hypothetical protein [Gammaproteobacteria bacterium]
KVYRSTKIKTGSQAIVSSMAPLVLVLFLFGVAVWGYGQASQILNRAYSMHPNGWKKCEANKAKTSPL